MAEKLEIMKKSYVTSPQDEWVIGNMKTILDWAKKYNNAQYNNIKTAFSNYRNASGLNSKVKAFQDIQNSLVNKDGVPLAEKMNSWYDEFEPKIRENADLYHNGDMDKVSLKPETKQMKDIWDAIRPSLSSIPKNEENDSDLDVGDIYKENYNPDQMAKLAAQYGYDYNDKNDRSEFLSLASKYNQEKDFEKIWNEPSFGNILTKIAFPVSTEYAKRNYNEIPTDSFWNFATGGENGKGMAIPMANDASSQAAMSYGGSLANLAKQPIAKTALSVAGQTLLSPAITEAGQIALNDKPVSDAAQDYIVGVGTNVAGPAMVYAPIRSVMEKSKYLNLEQPKQILQDQIDEAVNKATKTMKQIKSGKQIKKNDGSYKKMNKSGELVDTKFDPNSTFITEDELNNSYGISSLARSDVANPGKIVGTFGTNKTRKEILDKQRNFLSGIIPDKQIPKFWSNKIEEKINTKLSNREPLTEEDISFMVFNPNYRESKSNAIKRIYGENAEAPVSLFTNLASSNRAAGELTNGIQRLNGVYEYGQAQKKADELTMDDIEKNTEMGLYAKAYKNYLELRKKNFQIKEPKKPKDLSEDKAKKIRISIKSVYGL